MQSPPENQGASQKLGEKIVVLSGPSGSGKSTIVNRLLGAPPVKLMKMVSATTRPARAKEVDGEDYYFLTKEEFESKRIAGSFIEWAEVFGSGHFYGTLKSEIDRAAKANAWAFLEIDVQGALKVLKQYPSAVTIFLKTTSLDEYERRLRHRNTESEEVIQKRLATAREELKLADQYGYQVINDNLDDAIQEISRIIKSYS